MTAAQRLGALALLVALSAVATADNGGPQASLAAMPITTSGSQQLVGFVSVLKDDTGLLDIQQAMAPETASRFLALTTDSPPLGFQPGASWLRFALVNRQQQPVQRWLELGYPLVLHCTLYAVGSDGRITRTDSGASIAVDDRPVRTGTILLPIAMSAGEQKVFYLQQRGRTSHVAALTLWDPGAFAHSYSRTLAMKYLAIGTSAIVIVFSIAAAHVRRRWALAFAGAAHLMFALCLIAQDGLLVDLLPATEQPWQSQLSWSGAFAGFAFQFAFARAFLDLSQRRRWRNRIALACMLGCALLVPVPWLVFVPKVFSMLGVIVILMIGTLVASEAWKGSMEARLYCAVWGFFWVAVLVLMLQLLGLAAHLPFIVNGTVVAAFMLSSLLLCVALYHHIGNARREVDVARETLLAQLANEQQRLDSAIAAQTQALREAKARAEQASINKSAFLSASSHELRTPLHTIIGYTDLLLRNAQGETRARLQTVANSSRQLLRLIDDVLQFSRAQALAPQVRNDEVDMQSLLAHLERSGRLLAQRGSNRFTVSAHPNLPAFVLADEQRLLQVLGNLIENAAKYTDNGTIRLNVDIDAEAAGSGGSGALIPIRFSVADNGPGIPAEEHATIFQPFRRGSNRQHRPGAGLGLAIAQDIVMALGGQIQLRSSPGAGSDFFFTLKLAQRPAAAPRPSQQAQPIVGHYAPRRRLLLVDDNEENLHFLDEICRSMGFMTVLATDGARALRVCQARQERIDAALVDQLMPGLNGWEFLRTMRSDASTASIPLIMLSAAPAQPPDDLPFDMHFDATVLKPLDTTALATALERVLRVQWIRDNDFRDENEPRLTPPPEALAECAKLLEQGRITAIQRWAQGLATEQPQYAEFCKAVITACRAADLSAVREMIDAAPSTPALRGQARLR